MGAIFQSLSRTVIAGFVLLIALLLVVTALGGKAIAPGETYWWMLVTRWLHISFGVMWIGLLWYFNFVQMPSMPKIPDEQKPAVSKVIAPTALMWFRHAALWTVITGVTLASLNGYIVNALMLQSGTRAIGIGMWMALVMAFNVWFIIWPNQQKALGMVTVTPEEKTKAARMAMLASRFNTMFSIPMLFCMAAQSHGGF